MAKPILVIKFPKDISQAEVHSNMNGIASTDISNEYHVLYTITRSSEVKFECFNSPHTEIEFEELKKKLLEGMK